MIIRYASTFIVGFQEVVKELLQTAVPQLKIIRLLDGLVVFQGAISPDDVKRLRFFNNSYIILQTFDQLPSNAIHHMLNSVARDKSLQKKLNQPLKTIKAKQSFRLIASSENQTVSIDKNLRTTIENKLVALSSNKLTINRTRPDLEFWFLYRNEGLGFFLLRLTSQKSEPPLEKGELRLELSHFLCFISEPKESDIFLDPFCGSGSIPIERVKSFPCNMIFASDKDQEKVTAVKTKLKTQRQLKRKRIQKTFFVKNQDALHLASFEDGFIHKIVTDPPWGIFKQLDMDIVDFYSLMLKEFFRILKLDGHLVLLTARKEEFEIALSNFDHSFDLLNKYDILVSGKKAAVYKLKK